MGLVAMCSVLLWRSTHCEHSIRSQATTFTGERRRREGKGGSTEHSHSHHHTSKHNRDMDPNETSVFKLNTT